MTELQVWATIALGFCLLWHIVNVVARFKTIRLLADLAEEDAERVIQAATNGNKVEA